MKNLAAEALKSAPRLGTVDEFLEWAERQQDPYEFFDGRIRMMAGGTIPHEAISRNVLTTLDNSLRDGPCQAFGSSTSVQVGNNAPVPDALVTCTLEHGNRVRHPVLIVEVLSPSTETFDRNGKWRLYRTLPSLRHYLLLDQTRPSAELFSRASPDDLWVVSYHEGLEAELSLPALGLRLPLAELYRGVDFEQPDAG